MEVEELEMFEPFFDYFRRVMLSLEFFGKKGEPVLLIHSQSYRGCVGMAVLTKAVTHIVRRVGRLATSRISQDHIELLFGIFRSRCGSGNNPDASMLAYIVRLSLFAHVPSGKHGNALPEVIQSRSLHLPIISAQFAIAVT
jgi:hypothetical protein